MARRERRLSLAHDILRLPSRPLLYFVIAGLALLLLPYVLTPFYAFGRPVSTVMLWRQLTGQRVVRDYAPLSADLAAAASLPS